MKKNILIIAAILMAGFANAQSNKEEVDILQAAVGMDKKDMVTGFLQLAPENPFWKVYDEYEAKRKELGKKRIDLLSRYAENYMNLTDAEIDAYMKEVKSLKASSDKLIDTYYGKVKKASGSKVAAQFYEIENYIISTIRLEVLDNIPFFGELDN
jgi:hypothetical protein